ncbi:MAG: Ig-like domain-containing protein [Terriglobales bacterium]|jgi:hypothetical protein
MRRQILLTAALLLFISIPVYAGGPAFVAGSGYNPGVEGQPLLWANASVEYFTDQGDLSPILTNAQANAFVVTAITPWTSAPGVGLTVTWEGELAEDVNGSNIQATIGGVITAPADITSSATSTPLGIVYDYDGTVTDAVLGEGAGDLEDCFTNAVYGGPDNFAASGNIVHALVIINGVCAATSAQLPDVQYRLVRVLARCFGQGWSQADLNVQTGNPPPTAADYAGFPVMHFMDPISCVPISVCYPNAAVPKMDDITALARLYPATGGNPQLAGRVWGKLYFTDSSGNATQPMQGINVVARLMVSNQPSRQYVVTSVSGFEFVGNAGNIVTGYVDANGLRFDRFGSNDTSLEGFFDLGELTVPTGQTIAEYQVSVEAIDPNWSWGVEPYGPTQVAPSGSFAPVVVTVAAGSNAERDILMLGSEIAQVHPGTGSTYMNPAALPQGGGWGSWISGYGSTDWFEFAAQANRTASIAATALDENGNPTESKLLPILGVWELSDDTGNPAPAATPSAFNSMTFGMSRLDVQFSSTESYRLGVADYRGDGRPDYSYQASVLYSDTVTPARLSLAGGVTTLVGIGFKPALQVSADGISGGVLSQSATQMQVILPSTPHDGLATIQVTDPATGSFSQMIGALTYGAAATDELLLLQGAEPSTPIGAQAANLLRVRAVASDGVTPVNGATIAWSATNATQISACSEGSSCSALTDEAGEASTWVTPTALGQSTIVAALAPASYSPPQMQQMTLVATASTLDLAAITPKRWIAQGATINVPLTVEALNMGAPKPNVTVSYTITQGSASLSAATATTNSSGLATVTAQLTNLAATVQVNSCVTPANNPCQTFTLSATPSSMWALETVDGSQQVVPNGQSFQPLVMRVTDGSAADNPVQGVTVTFVTTLERNPQGAGGGPGPGGDAARAEDGMPIILGTSQAQVVTDANGLASITPTVGSQGPCDLFLAVTAGAAMAQFELESVDGTTISPQQPEHHNNRGGSRNAPHAGSGTVVLQDAAPEVFAVAQAMPAADNPRTDCSHASESDAVNNADMTSQACAPPDLPDAEVVRPPTEQPVEMPAKTKASDPIAPAMPIDRDVPVNDSSASNLLADKRSCRFAQAD